MFNIAEEFQEKVMRDLLAGAIRSHLPSVTKGSIEEKIYNDLLDELNDTVYKKAEEAAKMFPERKVSAIKHLRAWTDDNPGMECMNLRDAKHEIEQARFRLGMSKDNHR